MATTTTTVGELLHERAVGLHRRLFGLDCLICHGGSQYPCATCGGEITELAVALDAVARDAIDATCRAFARMGETPAVPFLDPQGNVWLRNPRKES